MNIIKQQKQLIVKQQKQLRNKQKQLQHKQQHQQRLYKLLYEIRNESYKIYKTVYLTKYVVHFLKSGKLLPNSRLYLNTGINVPNTGLQQTSFTSSLDGSISSSYIDIKTSSSNITYQAFYIEEVSSGIYNASTTTISNNVLYAFINDSIQTNGVATDTAPVASAVFTVNTTNLTSSDIFVYMTGAGGAGGCDSTFDSDTNGATSNPASGGGGGGGLAWNTTTSAVNGSTISMQIGVGGQSYYEANNDTVNYCWPNPNGASNVCDTIISITGSDGNTITATAGGGSPGYGTNPGLGGEASWSSGINVSSYLTGGNGGASGSEEGQSPSVWSNGVTTSNCGVIMGGNNNMYYSQYSSQPAPIVMLAGSGGGGGANASTNSGSSVVGGTGGILGINGVAFPTNDIGCDPYIYSNSGCESAQTTGGYGSLGYYSYSSSNEANNSTCGVSYGYFLSGLCTSQSGGSNLLNNYISISGCGGAGVGANDSSPNLGGNGSNGMCLLYFPGLN